MRGTWVAVVVALACFGPYVAAGIRSEQVVIYLLAVVAVVTSAARMWLPWRLVAAVVAWLLIVLMAAIGTLTAGRYAGGDPLAGLDALLLPIATLLIVAAIPRDRRLGALRAVAAVVVAAGAANAAVAWMQSTGQMPSLLADWLPIGDETSGARAAVMGRYTGVLNQPALAGCFYGLALLLASWRINKRWLLVAVWVALCVGGALSGSKAFLYVGLPIALLYLLLTRTSRGVFGATILAGAATGVVAVAAGAIGGGLVGEVTGNRYGDEGAAGNVLRLAGESLALDPLGHGLGGRPRATDSQWLQVIDFAGIPGAVVLAVVLGLLWLAAWRAVDSPARALAVAVVVLVVVASFAFPLLTGNRIAPLLWLTIALATSATVEPKPTPPPSRDARQRQRRPAHQVRVARLSRVL